VAVVVAETAAVTPPLRRRTMPSTRRWPPTKEDFIRSFQAADSIQSLALSYGVPKHKINNLATKLRRKLGIPLKSMPNPRRTIRGDEIARLTKIAKESV
jgi:hypothetical protein